MAQHSVSCIITIKHFIVFIVGFILFRQTVRTSMQHVVSGRMCLHECRWHACTWAGELCSQQTPVCTCRSWHNDIITHIALLCVHPSAVLPFTVTMSEYQLVSNICCVSLTPARNTVWSKMCHEVTSTTANTWQRSVLRVWIQFFLFRPPVVSCSCSHLQIT